MGARTLISKRGRVYKDAVARAVVAARAKRHLTGRLSVDIVLHPPDRRRRDIDNSCKSLIDSLQNAGVFVDDSQIDRLLVERGEIEKGGWVLATIKESRTSDRDISTK